MNVQRITSRQNPLLQTVAKLLSSRSERYKRRQFVADGRKLLDEAVCWGAALQAVVLSDQISCPPLPEDIRVVQVPDGLMRQISRMEAPQGVLLLCDMPEEKPLEIQPGSLVLDGIQDPGNLGTILRTADALDVPVILTEGCADPYNEKTVRATMGSVFRTPPQQASRAAVLEQCRNILLAVTALSPEAIDLREAALPSCAVVIGSEGRGVSREFLQRADQQLIIPMQPRCESLNAAVAAAIVMWEMKR